MAGWASSPFARTVPGGLWACYDLRTTRPEAVTFLLCVRLIGRYFPTSLRVPLIFSSTYDWQLNCKRSCSHNSGEPLSGFRFSLESLHWDRIAAQSFAVFDIEIPTKLFFRAAKEIEP